MSIVDGVCEELRRCAFSKLSAVHVRVGRLSGVDKQALLFSYTVACEDTPLQNSELIVEDVEVSIFCRACGQERPIESFPVLSCAHCGSLAERVVRGQELEITGLEGVP